MVFDGESIDNSASIFVQGIYKAHAFDKQMHYAISYSYYSCLMYNIHDWINVIVQCWKVDTLHYTQIFTLEYYWNEDIDV